MRTAGIAGMFRKGAHMYSITNAQSWSQFLADRTGSGGGAAKTDDAFARIFGSTLNGPKFGNTLQDVLDKLSQRFPAVNVTRANDPDDGDLAAEEPATSGDEAAISQNVLAKMLGNGELAKKVEDAISAFLERSGGSNLMQFEGATVRRSLSITLTTVSYGEFHYSGDNKELLASTDLKTGFHDRLTEMVKRFFGLAEDAGDGDDKSGAAEETGKTEAAQSGKSGVFASAGMWSLDIFYSSSYISSLANGGGQAVSAQSWNYSASFFGSYSQGFASQLLPESLAGLARQDGGSYRYGETSGSSSSLPQNVKDVLSELGFETGGFWSGGDGFHISLRERRNLLSELMELYRAKIGQDTPAAQPEAEDEAEGGEMAAPEVASVPADSSDSGEGVSALAG